MDPGKHLFGVVLVLLSLAPPCRSEVPPQEALGIYERTASGQRDFSPLWGMAALQSGYLANLRLFGAYGSVPVPEFPRHPSLEPQDNCPLDATAAVIQYLFPSPDGANFVLNERGKDPVGEIAREQAEHRSDPQPSRGLGKIAALLHAAAGYRTQLALGPRVEAAAAQVFRAEVDHILGHADGGKGEKTVALRRQFAALLQRAILDETRRAGGIYPPDIVEVALLAYAWKAADHVQELEDALAPLLARPEVRPPRYDAEYHHAHADALWKRLEASGEAKSEPTPEEVCLLLFGTQEYQRNGLPALISYGMAQYDGQAYPDCGETSLRNFCNIVLARDGVIAPDSLEALRARCAGPDEERKGPAPGGLDAFLHFYQDYSRLSDQYSGMARDAWSNVVSNRNREHDPLPIVYRGGTHNLSGGPGLVNMLNLIAHLLPDPVLNQPWPHGSGARLEQAGRKLDALCRLASRDGFKLDWTVAGRKEVDTLHPTLCFSLNERAAFLWVFEKRHYSLVALSGPGGLGREGAGVARCGGVWAQAWWRRLSPSPYRILREPQDTPEPEPVRLTALDQVLGENLRDPDVALGLVEFMLAADPPLARTPTFSLLLSRTPVPDYQTAARVVYRLAGHLELTGDRGFYPLQAIQRWPQATKDSVLLEAAGRNPRVVQFMIDHGADVNAAGRDGSRPITLAIGRKWHGRQAEECLRLLLRARPAPNLEVIGPRGLTPLTQALEGGADWAQLLAAGADPNARDGRDQTPFQCAVDKRNLKAAEELLKAGADPFRAGKDGLNAVDQARIHKRNDFLALIERFFPGRTQDSTHRPAP